MSRPIFALLLALTACAEKSGDDTSASEHTGASEDSSADTDSDTDTQADTGGEADGATLYARWCASYHGASAEGTSQAPGLEREVQHHSDEDLITVVLSGKGEMDPIAVTRPEAEAIIGYLRDLFG